MNKHGKHKFVIIDTETTSLNSRTGEIIEFSIGIMYGRSLKRTITRKVKPDRISEADPRSLEINGYDPADWTDAIDQCTAAGMLAIELENADIWIGHNPNFDRRFVSSLFLRHLAKGSWRIPKLMIDTQTLSVEAFGRYGLTSSSLDNIRSFLRWDKSGAHRAQKDMLDTYKLYLTCTNSWKRFWAILLRNG